MARYFAGLFLLFCTITHGFAQEAAGATVVADTVFAVRKGPDLVVRHYSRPGESLAMLAERFLVSQNQIEALSMLDGRRKLEPGTLVFIPVARENFLAVREPSGMDHKEPLYYRVRERDNIAVIAMYAGIKKDELILWNTLHGNTLAEGQPLFIGWIKMVAHDSIAVANGVAWPSERRKVRPDTVRHAFGELDSVYNTQTANGTNVITEKGTAVFFDKSGKNNIYYAFHSTSQRGSIIKVVNPGTGRVVYAKVLGPLPATKLYANAVIGISNQAKEALGVVDDKAWCELFYAPN